MATLGYTVWASAAEVAHGSVISESKITPTGTTGQTAVMDSAASSTKSRRRVRIFSDVNVWVTWGTDPTATTAGTSGRMLGIENPEYFEILAGDKIAVILR